MDHKSWLDDLKYDKEILEGLLDSVSVITPETDEKLRVLCHEIRRKINNPINDGNKEDPDLFCVCRFEYLYEHVSGMVKSNSALIPR